MVPGARVAVVEPDAHALWAAQKVDRTIDGKDANSEDADGKAPDETASAAAGADLSYG